MGDITFEIIFIVVLLLANGAFSMSEMAVVSARKARLQKRAADGDKGAQAALALASRWSSANGSPSAPPCTAPNVRHRRVLRVARPEKPQQPVGRALEQPDERRSDHRQPAHRAGHERGQRTRS